MSTLAITPNPAPAPASTEGNNDRAILAYLAAALEEGEAFVKSQKGYDRFQETIDGIMGDKTISDQTSLSSFDANHFGKVALDMVAALTDIKPFWEYKTFNRRFDQQADMLGKLSQSWFTNRAIDLKFSNVVKYSVAMGTGYSHLFWNPDTQDIDLLAEDPRDVIPIRPGDLFSIQDAQGVIIRRERPVNYLKSRYPAKASIIKADRDGSYALQQAQSRSTQMSTLGLTSGFLTNLFNSISAKPHTNLGAFPVVDEFTCYIKDESINTSGAPRQMGDPATNWGYVVQHGEKLYPRKRCIVFTRTAILYDGPNIYWHGMFPVSKLTLDPWPWSWLGKSPMKDLLPLKRELAELLRDVAAHNRRVRRPGVVADKNSVSRAAMQALDTSKAGLKLRYNPVAGKGVEIINEPPLDTSIPTTIDWIIKQMKELSGVSDLTQLNGLNQIPSAETVEKIMESMSLSVRLRSRVMETFLREFAMMAASNFFQFYTLPQRIAVLGPSGMTFDDFDFDPQTMIPDMIEILGHDGTGNPLPRYERAREFLRYFTYHVAPGSLLAASEITKKLLYLQLFRAGVLDVWTLFDVLGIPNGGEPPAATIPERLQAMQQMQIGAQVSSVGRKASAQQMPSMTSNGGISESG